MSDEREHTSWKEWLGVYADLFQIGAGLIAVLSLILYLSGALPGPVALFIGGICIGAFLFLIIGQQFVSNNRPIESIGAHLPNEPKASGGRPPKRIQTEFERLHGLAERDKTEIDKYVVVRDPAVNYDGINADPPYIDITFKVLNYSIHRISIYPNDPIGSVYWNSQEISGNLKMKAPIENLSRGDGFMMLALKQWVSREEIPHLINPLIDSEQDSVLKFDEVLITIRGADDSLGVEPRRLRLPPIPIKETYPINLRVEELKNRIKELELELEEEVKKTRFEANQKDALRAHRDSIESELGAYKWLHEMAAKQAKDISKYVVVKKAYFCYHKLKESIPYIVFGVDIRNNSVFEITIEDEMRGAIKLAGEPFLREKQMIYNPGAIRPMSKGTLTIKQRLSPEEAALIQTCEDGMHGAFYYMDELIIMIGEGTQFPKYERARLMLPQSVGHRDNWLSNVAKFDKENFSKVVQVRHATWNPHYMSEEIPYTEFTFTVFNASVYELSVLETVGGYIQFASNRLGGHLRLAESSARKLRHGETARIRVIQWLSAEEVAAISIAPEVDMRFAFSVKKLFVLVDSEDGEGIKPAPLSFPFGIYKNSTSYS